MATLTKKDLLEAIDESDQGYRTIPHICILEKKDRLESEVDEYLKKM